MGGQWGVLGGDANGWVIADDGAEDALKRGAEHLVVRQDELFEVPTLTGYEKVRFAGDPKASAGNVINCRCNNALVPRRDKNGRIVRV